MQAAVRNWGLKHNKKATIIVSSKDARVAAEKKRNSQGKAGIITQERHELRLERSIDPRMSWGNSMAYSLKYKLIRHYKQTKI